MIRCRPMDMKPLEQIICMVWLASNHTIEELRFKQTLIEKQIRIAIRKRKPQNTFANLTMMQINVDAAVAYQSFPDTLTWTAFIEVN